jgi:hypothetical protein
MVTRASKAVVDYRERASRVHELASTVMSASVRRAPLNVAARYDMADDMSKRGKQDRAGVAGEQSYEVDYFGRKHGISREQREQLIRQVRNDGARLDEAEKLKGR